MNKTKSTSPWSWVPTLYFAEALPNVAVVTISVIMYKRMGISNSDIALYTSLLYLPWVIKPFWSPFVDLLKTKSWWIVTMQFVLGLVFAGIALSVPLPFFFKATLFFFWLLAFSSATHDIAADGFYMLALDTNAQSKFVGIRNTFYRFAFIAGQGLLIILAGLIESNTGAKPLDFHVNVSPKYAHTALVIPKVENLSKSGSELQFLTDKKDIKIGTTTLNADSANAFISKISDMNKANGFVHADVTKKDEKKNESFWTSYVSKPLGNWIKDNFGEKRKVVADTKFAGNIAVVAVRLSQAPNDDKDILLNTTMDDGDKSISLVEGEHMKFNRKNWNKTAYLVFQLDPKLSKEAKATFQSASGNIPLAWAVTFFVLAGFYVLMSFYHRKALPKVEKSDTESSPKTASDIMSEFGKTFATFFKKPHVWSALFFLLTFRFSEAQVLKLINPFLLDSRNLGGLGLTTGEVGLVYGTIGILGLTIGGIIGGFAAAKGGLKKWVWPMTLSMLLTIVAFIYLSFSQTHNFFAINACVFIEQFGYGFGFTAYMLYMIYFADGEHKTAHYAFCTGFMALGLMLPGLFAGWLEELLGYSHFFVWTIICSILPIVAVSLLKIDAEFGKAKK